MFCHTRAGAWVKVRLCLLLQVGLLKAYFSKWVSHGANGSSLHREPCQYAANVMEDPTLMEECMTHLSTRLASRECRYMTYCRLRLEHLLEENGRKLAAARSKKRDGTILARLLNASLVPKDTSSITVDVLKGATKLLCRR